MHPFIKYLPQNLSEVYMPKHKVVTLYSGTEVGNGSLCTCVASVHVTLGPVKTRCLCPVLGHGH